MVSPKVCVSFLISLDCGGKMLPEKLTRGNGTVYYTDRILDIRQSTTLKAGSGGDHCTTSELSHSIWCMHHDNEYNNHLISSL